MLADLTSKKAFLCIVKVHNNNGKRSIHYLNVPMWECVMQRLQVFLCEIVIAIKRTFPTMLGHWENV